MKIVMARPNFFPEISAGIHLANDLIEDIIKEKIELELVVPIKKENLSKIDDNFNYKIHRVYSNIEGNGLIKRILRYIDTSFKMYKEIEKINDANLIFSHSMPPLLGPLCAKIGKKKKIPVIYWEQDIVSESIITTNISKNSFKTKIFYKIALFLEKYTEKNVHHIITISEKFKKYHVDRGINEDKISVVYNWIDVDQIIHVDRKNNKLFDELNLDRDKFYVTYCGNLGVPQNVEIMIDAAKILEKNKSIKFVLIGNGSREKKVLDYLKSVNPSNLIYSPLFPLNRSSEVYSIGNIGLVIGKKGTSKNGFPSKTWTIMSAEQAMISCFDIDSELSHFVKDGKCGIAIEPDNPELLANTILEIYNSKDKGKSFGYNARKYVINNFSREKMTSKIIEIIKNVE